MPRGPVERRTRKAAIEGSVSATSMLDQERGGPGPGRHAPGEFDESIGVRGSSEQAVPKSKYEVRTQSTDPDTACVALRKLANWMGRGVKVVPKLSRESRIAFALLKAMKGSAYAQKVCNGFPDDSSSDDEGKMGD